MRTGNSPREVAGKLRRAVVILSGAVGIGFVLRSELGLRFVWSSRHVRFACEWAFSLEPREWCKLYCDMSYRFSAMLHIPGDVRDAIAFYERAFGATTGWATPPADDMVAQLLVHGAEFWVHPAGEAIGNPSPQPGGTAVRLMLIVDNPDAVFDQAVAAGAVVRSPMQDREYGWRDGSVVDPLGHRWEIGKPL